MLRKDTALAGSILLRALLGVLMFATACSTGTVTTATGDPTAVPVPTAAPAQEVPASEDPGGQRPVGGQDAEAILAASESWLARGISAYSYSAQVFVTDYNDTFTVACGSTGGVINARVAAGTVVEARVPEVPCVIDVADPNRIPLTFQEWFDYLASVAPEALDTRFELGDFGEPQSFFSAGVDASVQFELIEFVPGAVGPDSVTPSTVASDLERAREQWEEIGLTDYTITVSRVCRCIADFRGPFDVTVRGGVAESVLVAGNPAVPEIEPDSLTVEGLFGQIDQLLSGDRLDAVFESSRGLPVTILSDPNLGTADDEVELRVIRFQPLPAVDDPIADALIALGSDVDGAPEGTIDLAGAHFCGVDEASLNDEAIAGDPIARACLVDGVTRGVPTVLVQVAPTIEGDPIIQVMRSTTDGTVIVATDSSRDAFGSGGWSRSTCTGVVSRPDVGLNFFVPDC